MYFQFFYRLQSCLFLKIKTSMMIHLVEFWWCLFRPNGVNISLTIVFFLVPIQTCRVENSTLVSYLNENNEWDQWVVCLLFIKGVCIQPLGKKTLLIGWSKNPCINTWHEPPNFSTRKLTVWLKHILFGFQKESNSMWKTSADDSARLLYLGGFDAVNLSLKSTMGQD